MTSFRHDICLAALLLSAAAVNPPPLGMARIPDGVYLPFYLAPNDPKEVPVKAFDLDILPVTNGEFLKFVRSNPRWRRSQVKQLFADGLYLKNWMGDLDPGTNAPANAPVTYVSWFAAKAFAHWKGKRLPTMSEWEYAASASPIRKDGENDGEFKRQVLAWYSSPAPARLSPAGKGRANFWGIHDLHGLIWEWAGDFNTAMVTGDARGGTGLDQQLFCGAGGQNARDTEDFPSFMRYGFRSSLKADYCIHNLGFRCARDL